MILLGQAIVSGLAIGAIYALAASGLGIVFGLFGVINFAHTQNMMVAAVAAVAAASLGAPFAVAALAGVLAAALLGVLTERFFIRPLLAHETVQIDTLFITLGLAIVIENAMLMLWGSQPRYFDAPLPGMIEAGGVVLTMDRLATIVAAVVVFAVLHLLVTRTRLGKAVLATAQNPEAARVIGIPVTRVRLLAFAVGCGVAGLGGVLWGVTYSVSYVTGSTFLILSFVLVVMSGPGNITSILVCSVLLGLTESLAGAFFDSKWQRLAVMLVFIAIIIYRPQGLGTGRFARANI
ncbi:MAG TPA: branched-chain amino acid ABC transporter permease [Burkholderiales bacterium]